MTAYNRLPTNLPDILKKHGLKVVEVSGWRERGRPTSTGGFNPVGVLCHHTATGKSSNDDSVVNLLVKGRSDLPGPLCHFGLARDGTVYLVSSGRANHAGVAKSSGTVAAGDGNVLYMGIEAFNDGVGEPWPTVQMNAYVLLCAVLCVELTGNSAQTVRGHKETSTSGKIDPTFEMNAFRAKVAYKMEELMAKPSVPKPPVAPKPVPPKPKKAYKDFLTHLVAGNKSNSMDSVKADMALVLKNTKGDSAVVFNTERATPEARQAVSDGLGKGFTRVLDNEVTIAFGSNWSLSGAAVAQLLAPEDPGMEGVSPNRYLDTAPLENKFLKDVVIKFKGTHWCSEANCVHVKVKGRAWRVKTWQIQLEDVLEDCQKDHDAGFPIVLEGDFNTGVHFNGDKLFAKFQERFGANVVHAFNGTLDHVFLISTDKVKLSEVGIATKTNDASDHDMVSVMVRAEVR